MNSVHRSPRFCPNCGALLPAGNPRFCIECGHQLQPLPASEATLSSPGSVMTVRLPNARVEQSVIGGTIRLPSSGAIPPGMWVLDEPPGAQHVVAIYAPLRAVVGGWSGLSGNGWRREERYAISGSRMVHTFTAERVWFPAPGCGGGLQLHVTIAATAESEEGKSRLGFRYREGSNPPMQVIRAEWRNANGEVIRHQPLPEIQIMAPPRVLRVSDFRETIRQMSTDEMKHWLAGSAVQGTYRLVGGNVQQRTPAGRGLVLTEVTSDTTKRRSWWQRLLAPGPTRYYIRVEYPLIIGLGEWKRQVKQMTHEAAGLGLDIETDAVIEWWLDRYAYDGVIFHGAAQRYQFDQVVVVFRRGQLAEV
ncbi:zinc ribbon domain-containing protein [Chloroflexus sp.]|uniref:zinc ribbon domain-containing protein n=1 Tax=Chloroflexus sp. TaxID=1904827 RepID=UPI002ADDA243|nr:zinc ribbon domain-containing protein [Chloroflexus sp.]